MNVFEKINKGLYEPTMGYPTRPKRNPILSKEAGSLTTAEAQSLLALLAEYATALNEYDVAVLRYREETNEGIARLIADLSIEHGVENNPKRHALWGKAWELGHSGGLSEVASHFVELVDLIK